MCPGKINAQTKIWIVACYRRDNRTRRGGTTANSARANGENNCSSRYNHNNSNDRKNIGLADEVLSLKKMERSIAGAGAGAVSERSRKSVTATVAATGARRV